MTSVSVAGPRTDRARKRQRQQALLRVVGERPLHTQEELVRALRAAGFHATQATVSRDIVELGLVKVARDGAHVYAPPAATAAGGIDRLRRFCEDYPVEVAVAGTIVVLRSLPGTANALAAALDASRLPEVVGTIAGDDTVFVAVAHERETRTVIDRLALFGVMQRRGAQT
ncbi:MAG: arginine repressor [Chloroflexota bacterium]|nr:arginine repressor [Chloroflexota bacterium]MDE3101951.1 arginine repressor [Chloroflexota bacterium]